MLFGRNLYFRHRIGSSFQVIARTIKVFDSEFLVYRISILAEYQVENFDIVSLVHSMESPLG